MYEKGVPLTIGGREYYLVFSLAAMALFVDKFGGTDELFDLFEVPEINPEDIGEIKREKQHKASKAKAKIMAELPWLISVMANQGTFLHNLECKSSKVELLTADVVGALLKPRDMKTATDAFVAAIRAGSAMEREDEKQSGPIDLGLQEIESKNASGAAG